MEDWTDFGSVYLSTAEPDQVLWWGTSDQMRRKNLKIIGGSLCDYLAATLQSAQEHQRVAPKLMPLIVQMDEIFQSDILGREFDVDPVTGFLAMHAYTMLLSSVREALSGHVVSTFPIVRAALESACYAYLIAHDPENGEVWLTRHESDATLKRCRKIFTVRRASEKLERKHPGMAEWVLDLYEASIDFGAHPNQKSVIGHLTDDGTADDSFHIFRLTGVYGHDSFEVNRALLACVETGQAVAFMLAACEEQHPLLSERIEVLQGWIDRKNEVVVEMERRAG